MRQQVTVSWCGTQVTTVRVDWQGTSLRTMTVQVLVTASGTHLQQVTWQDCSRT
jgi:hypothetical protein